MNRIRNQIVLCLSAGVLGLVWPLAVAVAQDGDKNVRDGLSIYREFLSRLDQGELASVQKGLQEFIERYESRPADEKDAAFLALRKFFYEIEEEQNRVQRLDGIALEKAFVESLARNGFRLWESEGYWYVDEHPKFLHKEFGKRVSEPIRAFLRLRVKELKEGFSDDAALEVSFENLAQRVRTWERYIAGHPDSPLQDEAKYFYQVYLGALLEGSNNTPVFDYVHGSENGADTLRQDVRAIYRRYVQDNPSTESGKTVKDYLALLEKSGFQRSEEVVGFLRAQDDIWSSIPRPDSW